MFIKSLLYFLCQIVVLILLLLIIIIIFTTFCSLFVKNKIYKKNNNLYRCIFNFWLNIAIIMGRVKIKTIGLEKLKDYDKVLFVGNHISNWDAMITAKILKKHKIAFISKESNFKIPIFGKIIRRCCYLEINRQDKRESLKTINIAANILQSKECSIAVYPEGTRNKSNNLLLPFHDGVFKIAQKASCPICIILVKETNNIHKNFPFKKTKVTFEIVDIINSEDVNNYTTHEIGKIVYKKLEDKLRME